MLVSVDLFLYEKYPLFKEKYDLNPDMFTSVNSVFSICVSNDALESFTASPSCCYKECIKQEAINNCNLGSWSSMLCVIACSIVLKHEISYYPTIGDSRICTVLNASLLPHNFSCDKLPIDILCAQYNESDNLFSANHFVPLFLIMVMITKEIR